MDEKVLGEAIEGIMNSFLEDIKIPFDVETFDPSSINPEEFWFKYIYISTYQEASVIHSVLCKRVNPMYASFLVNYEDLLHHVSEIFSTNVGGACSTDKARFVLDYCMKKALDPKCKKQIKRKDWVILDGNKWLKYLSLHPLINPRKVQEFAKETQLFYGRLSNSLITRRQFKFRTMFNFIQDNGLLTVKAGYPEREVTFQEIYKQSPENAYDWAKHTYPELLKEHRWKW